VRNTRQVKAQPKARAAKKGKVGMNNIGEVKPLDFSIFVCSIHCQDIKKNMIRATRLVMLLIIV
jgi:hypothetical protein